MFTIPKNDKDGAESVTALTPPRDIVDQCSRGFAFPADLPLLPGCSGVGSLPVGDMEKPFPYISGNDRFFPGLNFAGLN